jgi:hypothetical protein
MTMTTTTATEITGRTPKRVRAIDGQIEFLTVRVMADGLILIYNPREKQWTHRHTLSSREMATIRRWAESGELI